MAKDGIQQSNKAGGRPDLWLVGLNASVALAIGAFVAALTQPTDSPGIRDVLWTLTATGIVTMLLCLAGYFTQPRP